MTNTERNLSAARRGVAIDHDDADDLGAIRGLIRGALWSLPFWGAVVAMLWWLW